jgi:hypothetical protein
MFPNQLLESQAEVDYRRERIGAAFRKGITRGASGGTRHHHLPRRRRGAGT